MKLKLVTLEKTEVSTHDLPGQFDEEIRPDLIRRAVLAIQSHKRQRYGAKPEAGKRSSAKLSRRRRNYRGSYGLGISRVPRKILSRRGTRMNWVGAFAPGMVGGRRAHPPKASKDWEQKLNVQENRKAIRSAMAASLDKGYVRKRGHLIPEGYPFIVEDKIETLAKTKEVSAALAKLGFGHELERTQNTRIRPGRGKMRGRKHVRPVGPLLVVSTTCALSRAAHNIPGIQIVPVHELNAELLAPGTHPGRLTVYTQAALNRLHQEQLFTGVQQTKPKRETSVAPVQTQAEKKPRAKPAKAKTEAREKVQEKAAQKQPEKKAAPKKTKKHAP